MKKFDLLDAALLFQAVAMLCLASPMFVLIGVAARVWEFGLIFKFLFGGWISGFCFIGLSMWCDKVWMNKNFPR